MSAELVHCANFEAAPAQRKLLLADTRGLEAIFPGYEPATVIPKYTAIIGGYGSGKTHGLSWKLALRCFQNQGLAGMIIASDLVRLSRDIIPAFCQRFVDLGLQEPRWTKERSAVPGTPSRFLYIEELGVKVYAGSTARPDSIKGPNLAFIGLEEFTLLPRYIPGKTETVWSLLTSRLRLPGGTLTIDASGTPEGKQCWVCDPGRFETPPDDPAKLEQWTRDFLVIRASSWENRHNAEGYVQTMMDAMDPIQIREKVYGIPSAGTGGACYYAFDRARNVRPVKYDPYKGEVLIGQDYNVDPGCAVLAQLRGGVLYVFGEVCLPDSNTLAVAEELKRRCGRIRVHPHECRVFPDASGRSRQTAGSSDHNIMRAAGFTRLIYDREGNPRIFDRLNAMNGALWHGRIVVDPSCTRLIKDLMQVARGPDGRPLKGDKTLTHLSDALGYIVTRLMPIRRKGHGYARAA